MNKDSKARVRKKRSGRSAKAIKSRTLSNLITSYVIKRWSSAKRRYKNQRRWAKSRLEEFYLWIKSRKNRSTITKFLGLPAFGAFLAWSGIENAVVARRPLLVINKMEAGDLHWDMEQGIAHIKVSCSIENKGLDTAWDAAISWQGYSYSGDRVKGAADWVLEDAANRKGTRFSVTPGEPVKCGKVLDFPQQALGGSPSSVIMMEAVGVEYDQPDRKWWWQPTRGHTICTLQVVRIDPNDPTGGYQLPRYGEALYGDQVAVNVVGACRSD